MSKRAKLLWVDLEMSGLDPKKDKILEVAAIATGWDFTEIATYESAVKVDPGFVQARFEAGKEFWDANPQARDGLIAQNNGEHSRDSSLVEAKLLELVEEHFDSKSLVLLAGNSIHQDRKFIDNEWPKLSEKLHYRLLDVSAWKVVFEGKYKKKFGKPEAHRALDDIRGSIDELTYYLGKVKV